jgi:diguanylate cyclase (GGDEF)-like protein
MTLLAAVCLAGAIRLVTTLSPVAAGVLVGAVATGAWVYGLAVNGKHHGLSWRLAWALLGLGLLTVASATVVQALGPPADPSRSMVLPAMWMASGALAATGLAVLIWQRLPSRATEAVAESVLGAIALGVAVVALGIVPAVGWHPARELPLLAVPLVDLVVLWLAVSLIALTPEHPAGYRYLIAGVVCLFVASAAYCALVLSGRPPWGVIVSIALWGACLWAAAVLHPSQRAPFAPVPARSPRPSVAHISLMLSSTLVVPVVLVFRFVSTGAGHEPGMAIAAVALPLLATMYLLHRVFAHAAAEYRAQHDPLTGICNRTLFEDRLKTALVHAQRSGTTLGLMYLDLDRFKGINDSLGHAVGNQVLQAVVKRMQGCLRAQDTFARMGGDEFTFLLPDVKDKAQGRRFAKRALAAFADPIAVGGRQLTVQASAGVALYPDDGEDAETLLKNADMAMYQAKASGRNTFEVYDAAMTARAKLRFALESSLRGAVEGGRLAIHYQPKLHTASGRVVGVEALARWLHPRLGFIPPWAFIPLAEESTLVETIGAWVLEHACAQAQQWHAEGILDFPVAVNMSPRHISRQSAVRLVSDVLDRTGLDPRLLEIEVTESVLVDHMEEVTRTLRALRAMGIRCTIDDFGTGYSALTYLAECPVDAIKIDRSFVVRIDGDTSGAAIVSAVIALAHNLGLQVVAEGVETDSQLQFLKKKRCDQVQGFRFSAAVPADEFAVLVGQPASLAAGVLDPASARAFSVVSEERLNAVLDSMVQLPGRSTGLDVQSIESVLAALQREEALALKEQRALGSLPARLALGTLAGLTSMAGGLGAAGVIAPPSSRGLTMHTAQTASRVQPAWPPPPTPPMVGASSTPSAALVSSLWTQSDDPPPTAVDPTFPPDGELPGPDSPLTQAPPSSPTSAAAAQGSGAGGVLATTNTLVGTGATSPPSPGQGRGPGGGGAGSPPGGSGGSAGGSGGGSGGSGAAGGPGSGNAGGGKATGPGNSASAPGHQNPGGPGQGGSTGAAPGSSGKAPGHTKP